MRVRAIGESRSLIASEVNARAVALVLAALMALGLSCSAAAPTCQEEAAEGLRAELLDRLHDPGSFQEVGTTVYTFHNPTGNSANPLQDYVAAGGGFDMVLVNEYRASNAFGALRLGERWARSKTADCSGLVTIDGESTRLPSSLIHLQLVRQDATDYEGELRIERVYLPGSESHPGQDRH